MSWGLRILLAVFAVVIILGFTFMQGMFYANKKAIVRIANDNCYFCWQALTNAEEEQLKKPAYLQFKRELDVSSLKLAEMCLAYPSYIERKHYNLLVHIKKYKGTVDPKINQAISYLESTHDMKTWGTFDIGKFIKEKDNN